MKYLRKFETDVEKSAWQFSDECVKPNVVLVGGMVEYNVLNPAEMPMYIEALEDLTVQFSNTYEYSKDNDIWDSGTSYTKISATAGERVYFRASGLTPNSEKGIGFFTISNGTCNLGGNIMSMVYGGDYKGKVAFTASYQFFRLFNGAKGIIDASKLILPATTLASSCYENMFTGCRSLVNAPALPATTLAFSCYLKMFWNCTSLVNAPALPATDLSSYCYDSMFKGCSNLNYIKAMFKSTPGSSYTENWLSGVAATGTFVKNAAATWNVTGVNGIPEGWTVETAEA